jgi:SAM-dependent methyltransferase
MKKGDPMAEDGGHTHDLSLPAELMVKFAPLLRPEVLPGPVLDLASGEGQNGIFLSLRGLDVTCCDVSGEALDRAEEQAREQGTVIRTWQVDLEQPDDNPLPDDHYGAILVFRYLHRPLMPCIRKALKSSGILVYETFTVAQRQFGRPRRAVHLLEPGELRSFFSDWEILHDFEGILDDPLRAMAQLVCRKP